MTPNPLRANPPHSSSGIRWGKREIDAGRLVLSVGIPTESILEKAQAAAAPIPPTKNVKHTLSIRNVDYEGPEHFTKAQHKQALLANGSRGEDERARS